jgi:pilus assembly protein CpaE
MTDMVAHAALLPISKLEPDVTLVFVSPHEQHAQRLTARLRNLATVQWEKSVTDVMATTAVRQAGTRLMLLDYSSDATAGASELARWLMSHAPDISLVGVGSTHADHGVGVLAAWRAGVRDFLDLDATDEEIHNLLVRVQTPTEPARNEPAPTPSTPAPMTILLGVRPGIGTSTLAAHLGVLAMSAGRTASVEGASGNPEKSALLLDLGRPAGDALLYLGVDTGFHYDDALRSARRIDPTLIRTALGHHSSRLTLLSQIPGTLEAPRGDGDHDILIDRLRQHFDLLLCDFGGLSVSQIPAAFLREAHEIWLIADQSIGAMVSLDALLRDLEQAGMRDRRLSLVVNRYDEKSGIGAESMARRFNLPLLAVLPERSRALRASANQGQLLHQGSPRDPYVIALSPMLERLHINIKISRTAMASWKRLLTGLGGFRWKSV